MKTTTHIEVHGCDRCGLVWSNTWDFSVASSYRPMGWWSLLLDRAVAGKQDRNTFDLCPACVEDLTAWVTAPTSRRVP